MKQQTGDQKLSSRKCKTKKYQKYGMYIFPDAVIFFYPKRMFRKDCRYFPKSGISEIIIDDDLIGGYDQPIQRKYWIQFYFTYLSEKRKSLYVFSEFPFDEGGRLAYEELTKWLERGKKILPKLNRGKRV